MREEALELSLKYSFVTPLTSMVVTKPEGEKSDVFHKPKEGETPLHQSTSKKHWHNAKCPPSSPLSFISF